MNAVVGGLGANVATIARFRAMAAAAGADFVLTPELALTGYPPEDLLLREGFVEAARAAALEVGLETGVPPVLLGTVVVEGPGVALGDPADSREVSSGDSARSRIGNALVAISEGREVCVGVKRLLPNYDVFDERRYFVPGEGPHGIVNVRGAAVGLVICEDIWRADGPAAALAAQGATMLVVANASPYARGRQEEREAVVAARARETGCAIAYVNLVGGQDELVYDGQSFVVDASGTVVARAGSFGEELLVAEVEVAESAAGVELPVTYARDEGRVGTVPINRLCERLPEVEEIYEALVTGTRDYLRKNGFREAVICLSGGIDSSLVAAIAVDAVGSRAVRGYAMPSRYSSPHSLSDAEDLAARLDIELTTIPIEPAHAAFGAMLAPALEGEPEGLTDENLQSRVRGVLIMAISNETGAIVLTTGNKSEMATGYSTLYGDSAGGFAVIKDVPKTLVYELCRYRNERAVADGDPEPIPVSVLTKAPSAELRPDQRDDQSLPPYEELDPLLERYVEGDATVEELLMSGADAALARRVAKLVDRAEYKRRQMPPGVRISRKAFGRDRRMPITNAFQADA